jgi:hypothetical protein
MSPEKKDIDSHIPENTGLESLSVNAERRSSL